MSIIPDAPFTMRVRGKLYSLVMKKCGKNFQVSHSAVIRGSWNIEIGDNVYLAPNSYLLSRHGITIEDDVMIAINSIVVDANHGKLDGSYRFSRGKSTIIKIGRGSWVAANSVILPGATIGEGVLIGACCTINKEIPPHSIVHNSESSIIIKKKER